MKSKNFVLIICCCLLPFFMSSPCSHPPQFLLVCSVTYLATRGKTSQKERKQLATWGALNNRLTQQCQYRYRTNGPDSQGSIVLRKGKTISAHIRRSMGKNNISECCILWPRDLWHFANFILTCCLSCMNRMWRSKLMLIWSLQMSPSCTQEILTLPHSHNCF